MGVSYDYGSALDSISSISKVGSIFATFGLVTMLIGSTVGILMIISYWKIFVKCGKPGWYVLIPILNLWTMFEIADIRGWWIFVPFANMIFAIKSMFNLAKKFGKSTGFAVGMLFIPYVFYPLLAFGKSSVGGVSQPVNNGYANPTPVNNGYVNPTAVNNEYTNPAPVNNEYTNPTPVNNEYTNPAPVNNEYVNPAPVQPQNVVNEAEKFKFCPNCGNKSDVKAEFCFLCGHKY